MWSYNYSTPYLAHHGILGMKWGVRRFQNADGSLTSAGRKRYNVGIDSTKSRAKPAKLEDTSTDTNKHLDKLKEKDQSRTEKHGSYPGDGPKTHFSTAVSTSKTSIQRHRNNLVGEYLEKGYSEKAAQTVAKQRMRTEAALMIVGGIAIGIVAKKAITRVGQDYCDKIIKAGTVIQNIGAGSKTTFSDAPFYAAVNKHDKRLYGMLFPRQSRFQELLTTKLGDYRGIYNNQLRVTKDVKMPSVNRAMNTLRGMMRNDSRFRSEVLEAFKETTYINDPEKLLATNPRKFYDTFNRLLPTSEFQSKGVSKTFYSELEKRGYNALLDINDIRYSGFKGVAKSPTIFFGKDIVEKIGSTKLSSLGIRMDAEAYSKEWLAKDIGKSLAGATGVYTVGKAVSDEKKVSDYMKEHPNSEMSRAEILKTIKREKKQHR